MPVAAHLAEPVAEIGPAIPENLIWRLSVDRYHAMIDAGILTTDDHVELLNGWLVPEMPKTPSHRLATGLMREAFERMLPTGWYVDSQEPITTADSEPEPDIIIVRGSRRQYHDRHPGPEDLALLVEIADSSLDRDRSLKKRLYAAAGVPVYWIVNLKDRCIELHQEPSGPADDPGYHRHRSYSQEEAIPFTIDGNEVALLEVAGLLP